MSKLPRKVIPRRDRPIGSRISRPARRTLGFMTKHPDAALSLTMALGGPYAAYFYPREFAAAMVGVSELTHLTARHN